MILWILLKREGAFLMQEVVRALTYIAPVLLAAIIVTLLLDRRGLFKRFRVDFVSPRRESVLGLFLLVLAIALWFLLKIGLSPVIEQIQSAEGPWPNYSLAHMTLQLFSSGVGLTPFVLALLIRRQGLLTIGLSRNNLISSAFLGVIMVFVTIASYILVYGNVLTIMGAFSTSGFYYLVAMLSVGFVEEAIFRGYLQLRLAAWLGSFRAWILTAIVFTVGHFRQSILGLVSVFCIGLVFGWTMLKSKNIIGLSIWHAFMDWVWILR